MEYVENSINYAGKRATTLRPGAKPIKLFWA